MPKSTLFAAPLLSLLCVATAACGNSDATIDNGTDDAGDNRDNGDATTGKGHDAGGPSKDTGSGQEPDGDIGGGHDDATTGTDANSGTDASSGTDANSGTDASSGTDANSGTDAGTKDASTGTDSGQAIDASTCGPCATGFSCAPSGICKSAHGVPQFGQIYVIVMENHSASTITGSADATYIKSLMAANAQATNYQDSKQHPSLPNYVAIVSGDTQGITCDCQPGTQGSKCAGFCLLNAGSCNCNQPVAVKSVADDIEVKGKTWREYGDGANKPCDTGNHDHYAPKHSPFLYFDSIRTNAARCANIVPFTQLAGEVGSYDFSFIAPDLCNDMHDSCAPKNNAIAQGDAWLKDNVHVITDNAKFKQNGVLFITWDEGDSQVVSTDDHVAFIAISPFAKPASSTNAAYDHYSLLATIEEGLGLPRLGKAAQATPLNDIWK